MSVWWSLLKCGTWHDGQRANSYPAALKLGSNKNPASKGRLSRAHIDWTFIDAFWGGVLYNLGAVFVWRASQKQIFGLVGNLSWACTTSGPRGSALISIIGQNHGTNTQSTTVFYFYFWLRNEGYHLSKLVIFLLKTSSGIRGGPPTPPHPALQKNSTTSYSMGSIMHLFNSYLFKYMEVIQGWEWHLVEVWPWFGKWSIRKLSQDYRDTKPCSPQNHLHEFHCHFCMN